MTILDELRLAASNPLHCLSYPAWRVFDGAFVSLTRNTGEWPGYMLLSEMRKEVMSEAIEAAEALGL